MAIFRSSKSDDNIAALKGLLPDPEAEHRARGANKSGEWRVLYGSVFSGLLFVSVVVYLAARKTGKNHHWFQGKPLSSN